MANEDPLAVDLLLRLRNEIDQKLVELAQIQGNDEFVREVAFIEEFKALKQKYQFSTGDALTLLDPSRLFADDLNIDTIFEQLRTARPSSVKTVSNGAEGVTPQTPPAAGSSSSTGKGRPVRRYRNPLTGQVLETKGTNHKTLREWRAAHGRELVETWREV